MVEQEAKGQKEQVAGLVEEFPRGLAAQAALHLRRGDTHQAVEYYLEALEYAPNHALARKSLDFIRKRGDAETIEALVETGKIARFYPRPRPGVNPAAVGIGRDVAVGVAAGGGSTASGPNFLSAASSTLFSCVAAQSSTARRRAFITCSTFMPGGIGWFMMPAIGLSRRISSICN